MKKKILAEIDRRIIEIRKERRGVNQKGFSQWNEEYALRIKDLTQLRYFIYKLK